MASKTTYDYNRDTSASDNNDNDDHHQSFSQNSFNSASSQHNHFISQRQMSDSRTPTTTFLLFENASMTRSNEICFLGYDGTRARNHHANRLFLAQVAHVDQKSFDDSREQFGNCIKQVLTSIPSQELSSYVVSIRTGVLYFFSKRFRFKNNYSIEEINDVLQKKISTSNSRYYYDNNKNQNQADHRSSLDESLRSSFCNVKPISQPKAFAEILKHYQFYIKQQKHVFRVYLQSEDKQTHVCVVDPAANYSIVEFSKDFQRTSNIDYIRDRRQSQYQRSNSYDDIFDFRVQFQYNPRTRRDQMDTIEYELRQGFPSLDSTFRNENILQPLNNNINEDEEFHISEQLCPYIQFIRRDFGDIYHYEGDDPLFENFTIYLESPVEYRINRHEFICKRELSTHGIVYARLNLNTMTSSNEIDDDLLIRKLWDMGTGLTSTAGECTTPETQQSTNYYTVSGDKYTAEDEALVQTILKQSSLRSMLGLRNYAPGDEIVQKYNRIKDQLKTKWHYIRRGPIALEKLDACYEDYFRERN